MICKLMQRGLAGGGRLLLAGVALLAIMLATMQATLAGAEAQGQAQGQPRAPMPALVFDLDTGEVLLAHDAGQPWYPASLTKLMTAYLVMEAVDSGRLSFDDEAVVSRAAAYGVEKGAAIYGAKPGERMTIGRMLTFLMVRSDADMALALAEAVAGDFDSFVARMNQATGRLGMSGTYFVNPHGMHDAAQRTTARDMALLARAIYTRFLRRHPGWWRFFSLRKVEKTVRLKNGKTAQAKLKNRNYLLFMMPEANGMKTGFLCSSGFNLLGTARRGGVQLGAVVFGRRSAYNRAVVTRILLEEGFRRKRAGEGLRVPVSRLANLTTHAPNMARAICATRILPEVRPAAFAGWGVALGPFRSPMRALAATEAELLASELVDDETIAYGVAPVYLPVLRQTGMLEAWREMAGKNKRRRAPAGGFVWRLNEAQAVELCRRARLHGVGCGIQSPAELAALARIWPKRRRKRAAGTPATKTRGGARQGHGKRRVRARFSGGKLRVTPTHAPAR